MKNIQVLTTDSIPEKWEFLKELEGLNVTITDALSSVDLDKNILIIDVVEPKHDWLSWYKENSGNLDIFLFGNSSTFPQSRLHKTEKSLLEVIKMHFEIVYDHVID